MSVKYCSICSSSYCTEHATANLIRCGDDKFSCNTHEIIPTPHVSVPSVNKKSKCGGVGSKCKQGKSRRTKESRDGDKPKKGRKSSVDSASNRPRKSTNKILKIVVTGIRKRK